MNNKVILKYSLYAGAIYFFSVSIAHFVGFKVPMLFIYFNVPSFSYQDQIISFLAFGWAAFFYATAKSLTNLMPLLISAVVAILGLINITLNTNFVLVGYLEGTDWFWLQIIALSFYVAWLVFFSYRVSITK